MPIVARGSYEIARDIVRVRAARRLEASTFKSNRADSHCPCRAAKVAHGSNDGDL